MNYCSKQRFGGYAISAFNCNNLEIVQAIMAAAQAEQSQVIMQVVRGQ